jgi:tellurite resistance protein TerC
MNWIVWAGFFAIFIGVLALDLGVLHRESKAMSVRQALGWTIVWIAVDAGSSGRR